MCAQRGALGTCTKLTPRTRCARSLRISTCPSARLRLRPLSITRTASLALLLCHLTCLRGRPRRAPFRDTFSARPSQINASPKQLWMTLKWQLWQHIAILGGGSYLNKSIPFRWRDLKDWEEQEPQKASQIPYGDDRCLDLWTFRSGSKKVTLKTDSRAPRLRRPKLAPTFGGNTCAVHSS